MLEIFIQALFILTSLNQTAHFTPFFLGNHSMCPEVIIVIMKPGLTDKGLRGSSIDGLQRRPPFITTFPLHEEFIPFSGCGFGRYFMGGRSPVTSCILSACTTHLQSTLSPRQNSVPSWSSHIHCCNLLLTPSLAGPCKLALTASSLVNNSTNARLVLSSFSLNPS